MKVVYTDNVFGDSCIEETRYKTAELSIGKPHPLMKML